jgi:Lrp/AsnC family transcriptional regulator
MYQASTLNSDNICCSVRILVSVCTMPTSQLDEMDVKILRLLQEDASEPINQIADRVCLSTNACWRRIKRLEENGLIRKRVALVDAAKLGWGIVVFVSVKAFEHSEGWFEEFARAVNSISEVMEFYRMSGETDYLLKIRVRDIDHYDHVYKCLVKAIKVREISSSFAMEEMKNTTAVPFRPSDLHII